MDTRSTHNPLGWIDGELADLDRQGLRRRLTDRVGAQGAVVRLDGRELVNFSTNDYLGLAADPRLTQAVHAVLSTSRAGGAGPARLISGHSDLHRQLEERLAEFEQTEAALVFPSGFAANAGTIAALVGPGRRGLHRPQEPREPARRLPPLASRREGLSPRRLAAARPAPRARFGPQPPA